MKQKINVLIAFSAIVLIALSAMQYYLVKTAYDYKVEEFRAEIKDKIAKITNDYSDIDSTIFNKKDIYYKRLAENYIYDKGTRAMIKKALLSNDFKAELTRKLQQEFNQEIPDLKLDFAIVLNKFVIYENTKAADTIFAEKPLIGNKLYGDLASLDDAFLVRNYVGTTSGIANHERISSDYKLLTEDTLYVSVANWEQIIVKRMATIFVFAIFSILTLITLFVVAIKALIRQKKVSDVKTDFINNITHELKTPLTTLSVSTKILERKEIREDDAAFQSIVATIGRQNNRLQSLIDQVMSNSLGHSEIELQKEKVAANSLLLQIVNDFKVAHPTVQIDIDFPLNETNLTLDKFHLTTAIVNVLENAIKYGCRNISVKTSIDNNLYNINIQDDGIGIAKNKQLHLFEKFYRVEQGNLHNAKGLGLGLYYVDQIVKAHQGTIKVVSELGKGAAFNISIPSI
ncbi:sensor histidine kinase [Flavobacterium sp. 3HN19-14]|uniref:sensor histidine kinase n=1 Tax=Flavobacterium sp. 3HN19-14 TaxID=3448133 RepID=UPI003EE0E45C